MDYLNKAPRNIIGNNLTVVAGDDITLEVAFLHDDKPYSLGKGDTADLVIHMPDGEERIVPACSYRDNTAQFYLSGEDTKELLNANPYGNYRICVRVNWAYGGRDTPIYREYLFVQRC